MTRKLHLILALLLQAGLASAEQGDPALHALPSVADAVAAGGAFAPVDEVAARLAAGDPSLVILHVGHGRLGYEKGHVPGAVFVDHEAAMVPRPDRSSGLVAPDAAIPLFRRLGLTAESDVVLTGDASGVFPAPLRLALVRAAVGARLLHGQTRGWEAAGHPLWVQTTPPRPASDWEPSVVRAVEASPPEAADAAERGRLIDVREARQFAGERSGHGTKRAGHIPGAKNLPWQDLFTGVSPPLLRPRAELEEALRSIGIEPGGEAPVVLYDSIGTQVSLAHAVLEELGVPALVLTGGYAGWAEAGRPISTPHRSD